MFNVQLKDVPRAVFLNTYRGGRVAKFCSTQLCLSNWVAHGLVRVAHQKPNYAFAPLFLSGGFSSD